MEQLQPFLNIMSLRSKENSGERMPDHSSVDHRPTLWILYKAIERWFPQKIIGRKKMDVEPGEKKLHVHITGWMETNRKPF